MKLRTLPLLLSLGSYLSGVSSRRDPESNAGTIAVDLSINIALLPLCATTPQGDYDYIVIGAGAGGGPLAARLALNGFTVLLIDSGEDYVNYNTTVPLFLTRATEDPPIMLDYYSDNYAASANRNVKQWYPRATGLGGSTIHNALINELPHKWDFSRVQQAFGDDSWSPDNMFKYFTKIENNLYIPQDVGEPLGHGYDGWLYTDAPPTNLLTDPAVFDQQLIDLFTGVQNAVDPIPGVDWNTPANDLAEGGGIVGLTKDPSHKRSTIRDHLAKTISQKPGLKFLPKTVVTKIRTCRTLAGKVQAYGVATTGGAHLAGSAYFTGKTKYTETNYSAKYEVILAGGTMQSPQLLMLSGIGDSTKLKKLGITPVVNLPGVGQNLQDRLEMTIVWHTKAPFVALGGCTYGPTPDVDPCLKAWEDSQFTNVYASGPAVYAHSYKSSADLPYRNVWSMWGIAQFHGYYQGWGNEIAANPNAFINVVLLGHTNATGEITLTGSNIQDTIQINKGQGATPEFEADVEVMRQAMLRSRSLMANTPLMNQHIAEEHWPGSAVDETKLGEFIKENTWGHHICCTNAMRPSSDPKGVVNQNFQVYGVGNLRIVDNSVWDKIPGLFVTTPIYMISEKAADAVIAYASSKGWKPSAA